MGIGGDLAADLTEVMVHRGGIADRRDQRRFALLRADRTKQIGRGEAEILRRLICLLEARLELLDDLFVRLGEGGGLRRCRLGLAFDIPHHVEEDLDRAEIG
jgi:hypothetical protein